MLFARAYVHMKECNDQPGRVFAVFVAAPLLIAGSVWLRHDPSAAAMPVSAGIGLFGVLLGVWDAYWLAFRRPQESRPRDNNNSNDDLRVATYLSEIDCEPASRNDEDEASQDQLCLL